MKTILIAEEILRPSKISSEYATQVSFFSIEIQTIKGLKLNILFFVLPILSLFLFIKMENVDPNKQPTPFKTRDKIPRTPLYNKTKDLVFPDRVENYWFVDEHLATTKEKTSSSLCIIL
jgi:hypothetical protein